MKETNMYKLKKIELKDSPPDITVLNDNWDKIDFELDKRVLVDASLESKIEKVENDTNMLFTQMANTAPGGFGLGSGCVYVPNFNWNDAVGVGFYMGHNILNAPDMNWWMGYVIVHNEQFIHQIINSFNGSRNTMERFKISGVWSIWTPIYTAYSINASIAIPSSYLGEGGIHQTYE